MKKYLFLASLILAGSILSCAKPASDKGIKVIAYYYPHRGNFQPETLPLDKLTHIIFSFTEVIDNEMKFANDSTGLMLKTLVAEKKKHHNLKVMVACGGWEEFFTFIMKQTVYLSPMRILFQSGIRRNMQ